MYSAEAQVRVRYAEVDKMGFVYYGNYATYYEVGRVEALRKIGFVYRELEDNGIFMPVYECKSKYLKPAKYDDLLTIKVTIPTLPDVKMVFTYEIRNENDEVINKGETSLVFVDGSTNKLISMPRSLEKLFSPYFDS